MAQTDQIAALDLLRYVLDLELGFSVGGLKDTLYALSILSMENDHVFDDLVLEYHQKLTGLTAPHPTYEFTMGNKNVAEPGGVQMNGNWTHDANKGVMELLENIIRVRNGKR